MPDWDEWFRDGTYPRDPEPWPTLERYVETFPDGRALDVAAGNGRNALFLADRGYDVDALDASRVGLGLIREKAVDRGVDVNCLQADATEYPFPEGEYDLVTVSLFRVLDRMADLSATLKPDGILYYQQHLRTTDPVGRGPPADSHYRFASNELLRAALDLTVLYYQESRTSELDDGSVISTAVLIARNSEGQAQSYPFRQE